MGKQIDIIFLDQKKESWARDVDAIRTKLGAPHNPFLFPPHFLKTSFPKIGGKILLLMHNEDFLGAGFLFPQKIENEKHIFMMRVHFFANTSPIPSKELKTRVQEFINGDMVIFYNPPSEQQYKKDVVLINEEYEIGHTDQNEAKAIREIQREVWKSSDDFLYPSDMHSVAFHAGASLVARFHGKPIGFYFGFYKFGGLSLPDDWEKKYIGTFRLECQLIGVLQEHRNKSVGFMLAKVQAQLIKEEGIKIVNWTVDPLQYANAILYFTKLKAVAFDFFPDYYDFRNQLNQVSAARVNVTWLIDTDRVQEALTSPNPSIINLDTNPEIVIINDSYISHDLTSIAARIAIEIPEDWTGVQENDLDKAVPWRNVTSIIFQHYLGKDHGKYIITGVGEKKHRKYLIADKVNKDLIQSLSR